MSASEPSEQTPRVVASEQVYRGRVVNLRVDDVELEPGKVVRRELIEHSGAVVIVAEDAEGRLLWVRQHRYAAGRSLLELPAGTLETGEDPERCARREMEEETGFSARRWLLLGSFFTAPGFCTEYMYAYAASELSPATAVGDEDEDIEVVPMSVEESLRAIDEGVIEDAKSMAALHLWLRKVHRV